MLKRQQWSAEGQEKKRSIELCIDHFCSQVAGAAAAQQTGCRLHFYWQLSRERLHCGVRVYWLVSFGVTWREKHEGVHSLESVLQVQEAARHGCDVCWSERHSALVLVRAGWNSL